MGHTARILVVEDDAAIARLLGLLAGDEGYEALLTTTAEVAAGKLSGRIPDVMVVDVGLPDARAFRLVQALRELYGPVPLLTMATVRKRALAKLLGAYSFVDKPFELDFFIAELSRGLAALHRNALAASWP